MQECCDFLHAIQPFSVEKRSQIDAAIAWLDHRLTFPVRTFVHHFDRKLARTTYETLKELKNP